MDIIECNRYCSKYKVYNFKKLLGSGCFGVVFRAKIVATDEDVAIKLVRGDMIINGKHNDAQREAEILSCLVHPHIIKLLNTYEYTLPEKPSSLAIVTEFCPGGDLQSYLKTCRCVPFEKRIQWYQQLANAVQYMHGQRIVHRDLKPGNILVGNDGLKICDVGIANIGLDTIQGYYQIMTSAIGHDAYVAPEVLSQKRFKDMYTQQCDVFSLGLVFLVIAESLGEPLALYRGTKAPLGTVLDTYEALQSYDRPCNLMQSRMHYATDTEVTLFNMMLLYNSHDRIRINEVVLDVDNIMAKPQMNTEVEQLTSSMDCLSKTVMPRSLRMQHLREVADTVFNLATEFNKLTEELPKPRPYECIVAIEDVKTAYHKTNNMLQKMDEITRYCRGYMMEKAIAGCKENPPNIVPLVELIDKLMLSLENANLFLNELGKNCKRACNSCKDAAKAYKSRADKEKSKAHNTKSIGELAAGTMIAGVALSVVGIFTFGIGTVVGLTAAGASVVAGSAIVVGTERLAESYEEYQSALNNIADGFGCLDLSSSNLYETATVNHLDIQEARSISRQMRKQCKILDQSKLSMLVEILTSLQNQSSVVIELQNI